MLAVHCANACAVTPMVAALPQPTERVPSSAEMAQTVIGYEAAWISAVGSTAPRRPTPATLPSHSAVAVAAPHTYSYRNGKEYHWIHSDSPLPSVKARPCPV